jgi:hypothetical protein
MSRRLPATLSTKLRYNGPGTQWTSADTRGLFSLVSYGGAAGHSTASTASGRRGRGATAVPESGGRRVKPRGGSPLGASGRHGRARCLPNRAVRLYSSEVQQPVQPFSAPRHTRRDLYDRPRPIRLELRIRRPLPPWISSASRRATSSIAARRRADDFGKGPSHCRREA